MQWKVKAPWLLLSALWLESALFRPFLQARVPLFPFPGLWPAFWAVWLPPLLAVLLMLGIRRVLPDSGWQVWLMATPPGVYLAADAINFAEHMRRWQAILDVRMPAAFLILAAFVMAISQADRRGRRPGSWMSLAAAAGLVMAFWGSPYAALLIGLAMAGAVIRRHFLSSGPAQPSPEGDAPPPKA